MAVANLIKFAVWRSLLGGSYNAKMVCFGEGPWSYARMKKLFSFSSCKYTYGVVAGFLGCTTHYRVCLDSDVMVIAQFLLTLNCF